MTEISCSWHAQTGRVMVKKGRSKVVAFIVPKDWQWIVYSEPRQEQLAEPFERRKDAESFATKHFS